MGSKIKRIVPSPKKVKKENKKSKKPVKFSNSPWNHFIISTCIKKPLIFSIIP